MAAFYARYVPPSKSPERPETYDQPSSKRKHEDNQEQLEASRKRSRTKTADKAEQITRKQSAPTFQELHSGEIQGARDDGETSSIGRKMSHRGKPRSEGKEVLAKYSSIKAAKKSDDTYVSKLERRAGEAGALRPDPSTTELPTVYVKTRRETPKDATRDRAATTQDGDQPNPAVDEAQSLNSLHDRRYSAIRQKFEKSKAQSSATTLTRELDDKKRQGHGQSENGMEEAVAAAQRHGLEPLPQPPQPEPSTELPAYSTLPGWMATPLQVPSSFTAAFRDLNVDKHLVSNLGSKGLDKAFAVQAAVLPLLSEGKSRHRGDICISAATGSGKTLAYVLPLVQALKGVAGTKLRGLIVVPTRELVAQAREVCELCAAGTSLRIATAVGSKALRDEQALLVERRMVYDPEQYKQERGQPIDWTKFGLDDVLAELDEDPPAPNYVQGFSSKVDILITTPGRLVDHLRSTPGFHLEDVQWVVIDEADRLLNESFQEWIDVVMPALKSHAGTRSRNELLRELRLEVRERRVQKVVLSATMTQDISKLNSLDLRNPKLVAVGDIPKYQPGGENGVAGQDKEPVPDANGTFNVPPTLAEFAISVGDGSEKPLYLLKLIMSHILTPLKQQSGIQASSMASASSRSGSAVANGTALELEGTSSMDSPDTSDSDTSSYTSDSASSVGSHPPGTTPLAQTALIFTRSTEAATRLSRLLSLLSPSLAARLGTLTKSTHSSSSSSRKTLSHFRQGKIGLLVATDRASRGLDLPRLAHVISYDVPTSVTAYVHRVGRTARAGKEGKAWTLVSHREARWFWNEIGKAKESRARGEMRIGRGDRKVKRVRVDIDGEGEKEALKKRYEEALSVLGEEVRKKT